MESPWATRASRILVYSVTSRNREFHRFDKNEGIGLMQSNRALWVEPSKDIVEQFGTFYQMLSMIVTPEGAYGSKFAEDLLRTTQIMMDLVASDPLIKEISEQTFTKNKFLLSQHMTRALQANNENLKIELAPLSGALEGILSFHQFISSTLGEKIKGIDTGPEALRQIVHNGDSDKFGLTAEFTSRLSMGMVAPITLSGHYFKNPFEINADGKLTLTAYLKSTLAGFSKNIVDRGGRKARCPMTSLFKRFTAKSDKTGIDHAKVKKSET